MGDVVRNDITNVIVTNSASGALDEIAASFQRVNEQVASGVPLDAARARSLDELGVSTGRVTLGMTEAERVTATFNNVMLGTGSVTSAQAAALLQLARNLEEVAAAGLPASAAVMTVVGSMTALDMAEQGLSLQTMVKGLLDSTAAEDASTRATVSDTVATEAEIAAFDQKLAAVIAVNNAEVTLAARMSTREQVLSGLISAEQLETTGLNAQMIVGAGLDDFYSKFEANSRNVATTQTALGASSAYASQTMREQAAALGELDPFYATFEEASRATEAAELAQVQQTYALTTSLQEQSAAILASTSLEDNLRIAAESDTVATASEIEVFDAKLAAVTAVNVAEDEMRAKMTSREAEMAGLVSGEVNVAAGLEEWRASEAALAESTVTTTGAQATQLTASEALALRMGVVTEAELTNAAALGIDTQQLAQNAIANDAAAAAALREGQAALQSAAANDASSAIYGRLHIGALSVGEALGPLAIATIAVGAAFTYTAVEQSKWQTQLNELANNTSLATQDIQVMGQGILDLATKTGAGSEDLAAGARHILDYSFSASDALKILTEASEAAVSTGAKTESVAQGVAQALHQYGESAGEAANYTNILMRESQLANTTLQQFSDQTKTAIGFAGAIGNSYADTTAALAALTRTYGDASKAAAGLDDILRFMLKPTASEAAAWDDLAKKSGDANLSSSQLATTLGNEGLNGVINRVSEAYQKLGLSQQTAAQETLNLLSGQRGGIALYDLLSTGLKDYNGNLDQANQVIAGKLDPTSKAFNATLQTSQEKWDLLGASIHKATAEGSAFSNASGGIADALNSVVSSMPVALHDFTQWVDIGNNVSVTNKDGVITLTEYTQAMADADSKVGVYVNGIKQVSATQGDANNAALEASISNESFGKSFTTILSPADQAKKVVLDFANQVQTALNDTADSAKKSAQQIGSDFTSSLKEGFGNTVANTEGQMAQLKQEVDIATELGQEATKAGDTHSANMYAQLAAELINTTNQLNDQLTIAQQFALKMGQLGYDAGSNFAKAEAAGLANAQADTSDQHEHGILGNTTAPGNDRSSYNPFGYSNPGGYTDLGGITQAAVDANRKKLLAGGDIPNALIPNPSKERGGGGQSASEAQSSFLQAGQLYALQQKQLELETASATAKANLKAQIDKVTDADKEWTHELNMLTEAETANQKKEANDPVLNGAKQTSGMTKTMASQVAAQDAEAANKLTISIHQVNDQLTELDREASQAMAPLKANLEQDTEAMQALTKATDTQDLAYTRQKEAIAELEYQEQQQEKAAMTPLTDAYKASSLAVQNIQDHITDLTNQYDKELFPVEQKITKLEQERQQMQVDKTLDNEAQAAANLTAQLKNLVPGSAEYNSVLKQRNEAEQGLSIDTQLSSLNKQKDAIEARKTSALEAAKLELEAAQAKQKADKLAMDTEQAIFDKQKANLDEQAQNTAHEQTLYDEQQRDKQVAAQTQLDTDNAAIASQQKVSDARAAADKSYLTELENEQTEQAFTSGQDSYNWGLAVTAANNAVTLLEAPYTAEDTRLKGLATDVGDIKKAFDDNQQPITDHLQDIANAAQATLDVFNKNKTAIEQAQKYADAQTAFANAMDKTKEGAPLVGTAIANITTAADPATNSTKNLTAALGPDNTTGLNQAVTTLTTNLGQGLSSAISGIGGTVDPALSTLRQTVMKYMGLQQDPGFDASLSLGWFFDHKNQQGLYGRMIESANLAFGVDGLRGMYDKRWQDIDTDLQGRAVQTGDGIIGGIATGASTPAALKALTDAIVATVEAAIGATEKHIESGSPSRMTARRLGLPMGQGVAMGIDQAAGQAANSMRNLTETSMFGGAYGTSSARSGGAGGGNVIINMDGMHTHLHFPNVSKPPENPNAYTAAAADAIIQATQRRLKGRGLKTEIF